jgi:hypothetical protein
MVAEMVVTQAEMGAPVEAETVAAINPCFISASIGRI